MHSKLCAVLEKKIKKCITLREKMWLLPSRCIRGNASENVNFFFLAGGKKIRNWCKSMTKWTQDYTNEKLRENTCMHRINIYNEGRLTLKLKCSINISWHSLPTDKGKKHPDSCAFSNYTLHIKYSEPFLSCLDRKGEVEMKNRFEHVKVKRLAFSRLLNSSTWQIPGSFQKYI